MNSIEHSREDLTEVRVALDEFSGAVDAAVYELNKYLKYHFNARADVLNDVVWPAENAANASYRLASVVADRLDDDGWSVDDREAWALANPGLESA